MPFIATASEKLEAVPEADGEASSDEPGSQPESKTEKGQEEEEIEKEGEKEETKDDGTKTTPEGESSESTGEGQETSPAEPMSQEENLGALDETREGGAEEPMSQEETPGGLDSEPMSQSAPEHSEEVSAGEERQKAPSAETAANVPAEDDLVSRKRSAEQPAGDDSQTNVDQGVEMETDENNQDGAQTSAAEPEKREEGTGTCESSSVPNEGR